MELLIIPSILAIALKVAIFVRYHGSLRRDNINLGLFFLAVFFLNIAELLSIKATFAEPTLLLILLAYYCCVIFVIHAYINLSMAYAGFKWHADRIKLVLNILMAGLVLGMISSRSIIAGVEPTSYSLTRIAGPNYWLFQVYALAGLVFAVSLLVSGMRHAKSNLDRQRCLVVLLSTATPVLVTFAVVGLMAVGVAINAAIFMSLALTLMLGILMFAEARTRLFRLLTIVPYTRERRFHKQLLAQVTDCISIDDDPDTAQALNLKQMMRNFEGSVVEHVLGYYDGNQKKAASALGVSEATVSRRARSNNR